MTQVEEKFIWSFQCILNGRTPSLRQGNMFTPVCKCILFTGGVPDLAPPLNHSGTPPSRPLYCRLSQDQAVTPPRTRQMHTQGSGRYIHSSTRQVHSPEPGRYTPPGPGRYPPPRDTVKRICRYASYWEYTLVRLNTSSSTQMFQTCCRVSWFDF